MTGWEWDYVRQNVDLPRLDALSKMWRRYPPPAVQLARIAAFLGLKPEEEERQPDAQPEAQGAELMKLFPTGPMPVYLSPEEYLAQKKSNQEEKHG